MDAPPGAAFSGAPLVTYEDRLSTVAPGFGFLEITATDQAGTRHWTVLRQDTDGVVANATVQLPDLTGSGVTGLAPGNWSIRAETHLIISGSFGVDSYVLEELRRQQVLYARAAPVQFTVN